MISTSSNATRGSSPISSDAMSVVGKYLDLQSVAQASRVCKIWAEGLKEYQKLVRENEYARRLNFPSELLESFSKRQLSYIRLPEFIEGNDLTSPLMRYTDKYSSELELIMRIREKDEKNTKNKSDTLSTALRIRKDFDYDGAPYLKAVPLTEEMDLDEFLSKIYASQNYKSHLKKLSLFKRTLEKYSPRDEITAILEGTHPMATIDGSIQQTPPFSFVMPPPRSYEKELIAIGMCSFLLVFPSQKTGKNNLFDVIVMIFSPLMLLFMIKEINKKRFLNTL